MAKDRPLHPPAGTEESAQAMAEAPRDEKALLASQISAALVEEALPGKARSASDAPRDAEESIPSQIVGALFEEALPGRSASDIAGSGPKDLKSRAGRGTEPKSR